MGTDDRHRVRQGAGARRVAALAAIAALALATDVTAATASAAPARTSATPSCSAANTQVWLGNGQGGGTAGTVFFPLEFSNVGRHACTLLGYPGVSAFGANGRRVGAPANRVTGRHRVVTLARGATAHALLGIHDWGAICNRQVKASGLTVFAPGQRSSKQIDFPFGACARQSVLSVGPVRAGVGIPGFTTS